MEIINSTVSFTQCDMHFVRKFGIIQATDMVLDYKTVNPLPFIYDTYQLASFLELSRKGLFALVKNCDAQYRSITVQKKDGDFRCLQAPSSQLKRCQKRILCGMLNVLPVSKYAKAYVRGVSLAENAAPHTGKRYLLKLDITDFFGSVRFGQVYSAVFHTGNFPRQIGAMLTTLCCKEDVLPQGAPTSPALSNLVMYRFDNAIGHWCEKRGITYTRYCDDMTFSADVPLFHVYEKVKSMLGDMGFFLNEKKTRFVTSANRQVVTGLVVNDKVGIPSAYKRQLRQEIYYCMRYGVASHMQKAHIDGTAEDYVSVLLGKVAYVLSVCDSEQFRKYYQWLKREEMRLLLGEIGQISLL